MTETDSPASTSPTAAGRCTARVRRVCDAPHADVCDLELYRWDGGDYCPGAVDHLLLGEVLVLDPDAAARDAEPLLPVYDLEGHGIAVVEHRECTPHPWAVYVVADERLTRAQRARYVWPHGAHAPQLCDDAGEAARWAHRRTAALTV